MFRFKLCRNIHHIVTNKKDHMIKIRHKMRDSFQNPPVGNDEYYIGLVHTYPAWSFNFKKSILSDWAKSHVAHNPYGHTLAEFFKFSNGVLVYDKVMNVGVHGAHTNDILNRNKFINWIDSHEYYFDNKQEITDKVMEGNHQYGLLNRTFISLNLKVNKEEWDKMHDYYHQIKHDSETKQVKKFNLLIFNITNKIRHIFPSIYERGNCTYWTTRGFQNAGMLQTDSVFPLVSFYKLMINVLLKKTLYFRTKSDDDFNIVLYKGIKHESQPKGSLLYPFYGLKHTYRGVWMTERLANIIVELNQTDSKSHVYDDIIINVFDREHVYDKIEKVVAHLNKVLYGKI